MSETLVRQLGADKLPYHQRTARVTDLMSLKGKVCVVTAGAGPNLGRVNVERLAGLGADVAVLDIDLAGAEQVAAEISERWGTTCKGFRHDATSPEAARTVVGEIEAALGPIDVWVNNLGLAFGNTLFWERSVEDIDRQIAINYAAPLYCAHAVLPGMIARGSGRIINIASEGGKTATTGLAIYNGAKSGVIGFTRNLAHELRGTGVTTVCVCPGIMLTDDVIERMRALPDSDRVHSIAEAIGNVAAGRGSLPEEVANMVAFLATEAGAYVQATAVSVGGGLSDA
jgi:3-oxoacyl-[acyl-carrier protein] reductase